MSAIQYEWRKCIDNTFQLIDNTSLTIISLIMPNSATTLDVVSSQSYLQFASNTNNFYNKSDSQINRFQMCRFENEDKYYGRQSQSGKGETIDYINVKYFVSYLLAIINIINVANKTSCILLYSILNGSSKQFTVKVTKLFLVVLYLSLYVLSLSIKSSLRLCIMFHEYIMRIELICINNIVSVSLCRSWKKESVKYFKSFLH